MGTVSPPNVMSISSRHHSLYLSVCFAALVFAGSASAQTTQPPTTPTQVVATYFESLFKTRDFKTLASVLHPNAVYYQAEGLPYGGTYTGFAEWITMFQKAGSLFDMQVAEEPTYFFNAANNRIVLGFVIRCTAKMSGKTITMHISEHFEVKDGKIASIRPFYFDTKAFAEFLG